MFTLTFIHQNQLRVISLPNKQTALILRGLIPHSRLWVKKTELVK